MSIQTFSKSFLFSNNKEKLKMKLPIATGPARGNQLAHGHTRPAQTERRGVRRPGRGFGPWPLGPARPRQGSHAGVETPRRRGSASGPAAIAGRVRASGRAHGVRKELANASRPIGRVEEGKKGEFHGGRARRRHG